MVLFLFRKTNWYLTSVFYIMLGGAFPRPGVTGQTQEAAEEGPACTLQAMRGLFRETRLAGTKGSLSFQLDSHRATGTPLVHPGASACVQAASPGKVPHQPGLSRSRSAARPC